MNVMEWNTRGSSGRKSRARLMALAMTLMGAALLSSPVAGNEMPSLSGVATDSAKEVADETSAASSPAEQVTRTPEHVVQNPHSMAMTELHNHYRAQAGLPPQRVDVNLTNVAQNWANHMASVGSMYHGGGEQIIAYSGGDRSYSAGFQLWLGSSAHRSWLCSSGDLCGFGYAVGRDGCAYYAGAFGSSPTQTVFQTASYSQADQSQGQPAVTQASYSGGQYYYNYNSGGRRRFRRR